MRCKMLLVLILTASLWAQNQKTEKRIHTVFQVGPSYLSGMSSFDSPSQGGALHFDYARLGGTFDWQISSFVGGNWLKDYVNDTLNNQPKDFYRSSLFGGVILGPAVKVGKSPYFSGSAGFMIAGNYVVDTRYGGDNRPDREVKSETSDLSFGGAGTFGVGFLLGKSMLMELNMIAMLGASEKAPGLVGGIGPKLTFGVRY